MLTGPGTVHILLLRGFGLDGSNDAATLCGGTEPENGFTKLPLEDFLFG